MESAGITGEYSAYAPQSVSAQIVGGHLNSISLIVDEWETRNPFKQSQLRLTTSDQESSVKNLDKLMERMYGQQLARDCPNEIDVPALLKSGIEFNKSQLRKTSYRAYERSMQEVSEEDLNQPTNYRISWCFLLRQTKHQRSAVRKLNSATDTRSWTPCSTRHWSRPKKRGTRETN